MNDIVMNNNLCVLQMHVVCTQSSCMLHVHSFNSKALFSMWVHDAGPLQLYSPTIFHMHITLYMHSNVVWYWPKHILRIGWLFKHLDLRAICSLKSLRATRPFVFVPCFELHQLHSYISIAYRYLYGSFLQYNCGFLVQKLVINFDNFRLDASKMFSVLYI